MTFLCWVTTNLTLGCQHLDAVLEDIQAKKITANFYHQDGKRYLEPTTII